METRYICESTTILFWVNTNEYLGSLPKVNAPKNVTISSSSGAHFLLIFFAFATRVKAFSIDFLLLFAQDAISFEELDFGELKFQNSLQASLTKLSSLAATALIGTAFAAFKFCAGVKANRLVVNIPIASIERRESRFTFTGINLKSKESSR